MQPTRLFDIMDQQAQGQPVPSALVAKVNGHWQQWSSGDVVSQARSLSLGLLSLGLKKGERVGLISTNRPEWVITDLALLYLGAPSVPIYPTATAADFEFILAHAEARFVFVSSAAILDKIVKLRSHLPKLIDIYSFDHLDGAKHWSELTTLGNSADANRKAQHARAMASVTPDDLASVIYTSGTTGRPKGVMLSHHNFLANVLAVNDIMKTGHLTKALSFLPLSHVLERVVTFFYQLNGISIYYAESMETIASNAQEVHPHAFVTVPRLLEKIYDAIVAKGRSLTGIKRLLFHWALRLGLAYEPDKPGGPLARLQLAVARKLVFSKWRAALGGEMELIIVGGSALQPRLARVFWAAGFQVIEGYGLTETSPVIAFNTPTNNRIGTVGQVLANLQVKIKPEAGYRADEGEILVRGPSVMTGYYENPAATAEAIDRDGWFHTGDIGILEDGFLRITDRKKEMFKTSGGKYVAPLAIENKFRESPYIAMLLVTGENRKFASAIIVPEFTELLTWARREGVSTTDHAALILAPQVKALFDQEVLRLNQAFGRWEQIKQYRLVADEWSINSGELTPKLSLKRKVIEAKYKDLIEQIYDSPEAKSYASSTP